MAAVHLCIRRSILPFHLASVPDGLLLIFAHLIWQENKRLESFARETSERNEVRDPIKEQMPELTKLMTEMKYGINKEFVLNDKRDRWRRFYGTESNS